MGSNTRERIVDSSATLFRRQGFAGDGRQADRRRGRAPFASLYHFFPGGKDQLAEEVIRSAGVFYGQLIEGVFAGHRVLAGVTTASPAPRETLRQTTTPTPARSPRSRSRSPAPTSRSTWPPPRCSRAGSDRGPERFAGAGLPEALARELAIGMIAALEGAFVLSRAMRTTEPLEVAGAHAAAAVKAALSNIGVADGSVPAPVPARPAPG